jgi:cytochrome c-type biogenesis protein CcmH
MIRRLALYVVLLASMVAPALALAPEEILSDPKLEQRARALSKELRCMVCQNQSIDDSDAQLAKDLRVVVRERLQAGDTDAEILDFIVERYGEFALLRPRVTGHNAILWGAPLLIVIGASVWLLRRRASTSVSGENTTLNPDEEAEIAKIIKNANIDRAKI